MQNSGPTAREATPRVVVTGRGVLSPLGPDWTRTWSGLVNGNSGIRTLEGIDLEDLPVRVGGQVRDFDPAAHLPPALVRRTDPATRLGLSAAVMAVADSGLTIDAELAPRVGVLMGSVGSPTKMVIEWSAELQKNGFDGISPFVFASTGIVNIAGEVSLHLGARGPATAMATACATGSTCIGEAMGLIQQGRADVVIAGGVDETLTRFDIAVAARAGALSRRGGPPEAVSRPFDRERTGFVMSAGAGVLVLESAEHAERRGAHVYAELVGYGASTDAYHLTAPQPEGLAVERAMRAALDAASVSPAEVGYVNAHGTGTRLNDTVEVKVIRRVFGDDAVTVPISSTKSMTGHMLGAAGAVEAAVLTGVLETGTVPPTINCDDPEAADLNLVAHKAQEHRVNVAMSNSFGFGGHNAVLVMRRWRP